MCKQLANTVQYHYGCVVQLLESQSILQQYIISYFMSLVLSCIFLHPFITSVSQFQCRCFRSTVNYVIFIGSLPVKSGNGEKNTRPPNQTDTVFPYVFKSACCCFIFKTIPEIPPKPGELQTELRGYKVREEAAAALEQLKAQKKVD